MSDAVAQLDERRSGLLEDMDEVQYKITALRLEWEGMGAEQVRAASIAHKLEELLK